MEFIKKCMSAAPASFQDQYAKLHEQAQGELDKAAAAALELKEQASGGASGSSEPGSPELTGSLSATETSGSGFFPSLFRFMKDPKATAAGACSQLQDEVKNQGETEQDSGDGPVDRIRKYMRGELDFKGLGVCNCFIGPTVKPELQSNPKNKSAYGLGVCVCCIGGEKTKEQEADARKQVRMMLHKKFYGAGERPPLATGGAQGKVAQLEQDTVPTMQGAKARVGARMERIAALQNRAEERFQKAHEKFHDKGEGSVAHRAQQILARGSAAARAPNRRRRTRHANGTPRHVPPRASGGGAGCEWARGPPPLRPVGTHRGMPHDRRAPNNNVPLLTRSPRPLLGAGDGAAGTELRAPPGHG